MGCGPSKPDSHHAATAPVIAPSTKRKPVAKPVAASSTTSYETQLSASLVDAAPGAVAYHGLLSNQGNISLKRHHDDAAQKIVNRTFQPTDSHHSELHAQAGLSVASGVAMTMPYTVLVAKPNCESDINRLVNRCFEQANAVLNGWNPNSELSNLNSYPPGKSLSISKPLSHLFDIVDTAVRITEGRFDPTTGVLNIAFENCIKEKKRPPLPAEITPFKYAVGWTRRIKRDATSVSRSNANTIIDLDGISKGHVIDTILDTLVANHYQSVYIDWAGDIRAIGEHPAGRPWRAALITPPDLKRVFSHWQNSTLASMLQPQDVGHLASFSYNGRRDVAMATSGDYFSVQKYGYHHIARSVDLTVMKANQKSVASVCVAASTCAMADAVATASMTFDAVDDALTFLSNLCDAHSDHIFGFCVMGRAGIVQHSSNAPESPLFIALQAESKQGSSEMENEGDRVTDREMSVVRATAYKTEATIALGEHSLRIDSLTTLSMDPEQLLSFQVPLAFSAYASLDEASPNNKCKCVLHLEQPESRVELEPMSLEISFKHIYELEHAALVVARVNAINLGTINEFCVLYRGSVLGTQQLQLSYPRSQFSLQPLGSQCRDVFRHVPSMIWIVTVSSAEQHVFALTATSVTVADCMRDLLTFNFLHTSAFFAAFGGVGSTVRLHALSTDSQDLASRYSNQSQLRADDEGVLQMNSLFALECDVEMVKSVQDHVLVVVRAANIRFNDTPSAPLLWLKGGYLK